MVWVWSLASCSLSTSSSWTNSFTVSMYDQHVYMWACKPSKLLNHLLTQPHPTTMQHLTTSMVRSEINHEYNVIGKIAKCEKDVGMGLCQNVDLNLLSCIIPTLFAYSFGILHLFTFSMFFIFLFLYFLVLISVTAGPINSKKSILSSVHHWYP